MWHLFELMFEDCEDFCRCGEQLYVRGKAALCLQLLYCCPFSYSLDTGSQIAISPPVVDELRQLSVLVHSPDPKNQRHSDVLMISHDTFHRDPS